MSTLPKPVTLEAIRNIDKAAYKHRVLEDPLMKDVDSLIAYGKVVFDKLDNLIDLTDINSVKAKEITMKLPPGFIPLDETANSFYLKAKPHNGLRSLRRGFYKLIPEPELIDINEFKAWSMNVLFNEGPQSDKIFKYKCNVGPLLNKMAICRDLTVSRFVRINQQHKGKTLVDLSKITLYVSYAELVSVEETYKPYEIKEVLWFRW
ncbi:hypothetical protein [Mucilaginibacter sp.]